MVQAGLFVLYLMVAGTASVIQDASLACDRFGIHFGSYNWGLIYMTPAPISSLRLALRHYQRNAAGAFAADRDLNMKTFSTQAPHEKWPIHVLYKATQTYLFANDDSSPGTSVPFPKFYTVKERPMKIGEGIYILWLGSDKKAKPSLSDATEYLTLEITPNG